MELSFGGGGGVVEKRRKEKQYKGIRMRKWGKWVAEIREPNKRSRIWLGSYATPLAAARAYDTAVYCLRGAAGRFNFPEMVDVEGLDIVRGLSSEAIRAKAIEAGSKVDNMAAANETADSAVCRGDTGMGMRRSGSGFGGQRESSGLKACWSREKLDLNVKPEPEDLDGDYR